MADKVYALSIKLSDGTEKALEFTVPQGEKGNDGVGISNIYIDNNSCLVVETTDGMGYQSTSLRGPRGIDGTSVTVESVSESSVDGGSNIIAFSDGKTITIKNGSTGGTGATGTSGKDGKTPERGVDYWTELDQELIVQRVITELGGIPVLGRVEANNDIVLTGKLEDGIYTLKYEYTDGSQITIGTLNYTVEPEQPDSGDVPDTPVVSYTNLANPNDSYWQEGKRINSSGALTDWTGGVITNFIDVSGCKEYIHVKGIDLTQGNSRYYKYYTAGGDLAIATNIGVSGHVETASYDSSVTLIPARDIETAKIWRLGGLLTGTSADVVITIDEEIKTSETINMITKSINTDGTEYVGANGEDGYKPGYRLNSSGTETALASCVVTGYIPVKFGDVVRFKNCGWDTTSNGDDGTYITIYDSSFANITSCKVTFLENNAHLFRPIVIDENTKELLSVTMADGSMDYGYIRISTPNLNANSIITVNQEIPE